VARIDAHLLNREGVARLCYTGSVLHTRPRGLDATREPLQIGAEIYGGVISLYFSGRIAEPAVWDVSLSDDEIALLAKGFSPLFFRPQNLAAYWPLIALEDINDRIGGFNMTAVNTPVTADHMPKIIYPAPTLINYPAAAAAVHAGALVNAMRLKTKVGGSLIGA